MYKLNFTDHVKYEDVLTYKMTGPELLRAYIADKILDAFNGSYKPPALTPSRFEYPLARGAFQSVVKNDLYYLLTMDGMERRFVVSADARGLEKHLESVCLTFDAKDVTADTIFINPGVRQSIKSLSFDTLSFELERDFLSGKGIYAMNRLKGNESEETIAKYKEYDFELFGDGNREYYVLEI